MTRSQRTGRQAAARAVLVTGALVAGLLTAGPTATTSAAPAVRPAPVAASTPVDGEAGAASGSSAASHHGFLSQQGVRSRAIARWNPCGGAIGYRVSSAGGGRGATADVIGAVKRIRAVTGLPLVYRGQTKIVPGRGTARYPADTQIVIAWTRPGASRYLPKAPRGYLAAAGYGGGSWTSAHDARGRAWGRFVSGYVVLNSGYRLAGGFGKGPRTGWQGTRGQLLMHELGHAVGLDHTGDRSQIMYPSLTRKTAAYGAGDLAGLRTLGRASGCLYR